MSKSEQVNQELNTSEKLIYKTGEKLITSPVRPFGNSFFHLLRFLRRNHPVEPHNIPEKPERPSGPFVQTANGQNCALIIFVPRNFKSRLIDNFTGGYGYSHVAIDTGEIDQPTGKPVMIESTLFDVVHYSFQDTYGDRHFVKIPLDKIGLDCKTFRECVKSKLGEKYGYAEVLTWDEIDDPARQVCSDLAAVCMPDWFLEKIDQARKNGALPRNSISASHLRDNKLVMFISPNAFAKFFNAPHGEELVGPGIISEPMMITPVKKLRPAIYPGIGISILGILGLATWYYFGHARHRV